MQDDQFKYLEKKFQAFHITYILRDHLGPAFHWCSQKV